MKLRNVLAISLLVIGSLQMTGYLLHSRTLRGIGLASGISPFPKVFCEADGYEAFAASFEIRGTDPQGNPWSRPLDPEWYSQLRGPYNRRNVYGAALAFAPRLPDALRDHLLAESLAPDSALRAELGIPGNLKQLEVAITPRAGETGGPWTFPAPSQP
ncbi:MAG: hypothetical protein QM627_09565 [Luteolibacter sp.]